MQRIRRLVLGVAGVLAIGLLAAPLSPAQAASGVGFTAQLDGRATSALTTNSPLRLVRGKPLDVRLTVTNGSSRAITVGAARVDGTVMGLTFFSYDTQLNLKVPAGGRTSTHFQIGLVGLPDQADGLLPGSVALLDPSSHVLASTDYAVDVKGDLTSIYGVFGLAIAAITLLWLASLIYRVATRTLPANRWARAVQFSAAGFGLGLALTFSVSALRLLSPIAAVWAPFVFGAGAVGFAVGYLTPGPRVVAEDEEDEFIASRQALAVGAPSAEPYAGPARLGESSWASALDTGDPAALESGSYVPQQADGATRPIPHGEPGGFRDDGGVRDGSAPR